MPVRRLSWHAMQVLADDLPLATGFLEVFYPSWLLRRGLTAATLPSEIMGNVGYGWGPDAADSPQKKEFLAAMAKGGGNQGIPSAQLYHSVKI